MIVVEGPDGAGKTTLIKHLVEGTGLMVAPRVVSKDAEAMVDLVAWTEDNVQRGWQPIIFDRHRLISEPIYGPTLRQEWQPGFDNPIWLAGMMRMFYGCSPTMIYCLPDFAVVKKNISNDPDNRVVQDDSIIRSIWGAYLNKIVTDVANYPDTWVYDYTDSSEKIEDMLVFHIKNRIKEKY